MKISLISETQKLKTPASLLELSLFIMLYSLCNYAPINIINNYKRQFIFKEEVGGSV